MTVSNRLRASLRVALGHPASTSELIGTLDGIAETGPGGKFYVDSGAGSSANDGLSWLAPKATLAQAIALCTADDGDVIFLAPGHAETIVGAAGSGITKSGVRVVGLGSGRLRPTFTFTTATAASFDITAANTSIENCVFINGIDAQTAMMNISAANVVVADCEFMLGDACTQAALGILTTAGGTRSQFLRNHMHGSVDAGVAAAIRVVGGDAIVIEDNVLVGAFAATGCISNTGTATTMLVIRRNHLLNKTADGNNKLIVADASTTGLIVHNAGGIIDSSCPAPVTAAAMHVGGNHFSTAAGVTASVLM